MTSRRKLKDRLDVQGREEQKMMDLPSLGKIHWTSYNGIMECGRGNMPRWEGKLMSASSLLQRHCCRVRRIQKYGSVSPGEVTPRDKELGIISIQVIVETIRVVEGRRKEG